MFRAPSSYLAQESTKMGGCPGQSQASGTPPAGSCVCVWPSPSHCTLLSPCPLLGAAQDHSAAQTRVRSQGDAGEQVKEAVAGDFIDIGDARTF